VIDPGDVYVIVAGDDSVFWIEIEGEIRGYEFDVSSFDQSESSGPLLYEYSTLRMLGVPPDVTDRLFKIAKSPLRVNLRNGNSVLLDRSSRPFRDTGGPDTTLGNGIVNGGAIYHVFDNWICWNSISAVEDSFIMGMARLGFKVKGGFCKGGSESFLKGLWYPTDRGKIWGPVPSRVIKLGKASKDPRVSYKIKSLSKAVARHAAVVADGYRGFLQVPILRIYVAKYGDKLVQVEEEWKIKTSFRFKEVRYLDQEVMTLLYHRYSLSERDIYEMECLYLKANLFSLLSHPGFWKLSRVDYGS
jgi:hypothetical protein